MSQASVARSYRSSSIPVPNASGPSWGSPISPYDQTSSRGGIPQYPIDYSTDPNPEVGYVLDQNNHFVRGTYNIRHTPFIPSLPPVYAMLPRVMERGPLDTLMLDFLIKTQRLAATGVSSKELAGPAFPSWNIMLNPNTSHQPHLLSKVFTDILHTFPDLNKLPEQAAVVFIMFLVMRWQVNPTKENYERMPEWIRPRAEQLFVIHPHWLDYIPW
jgi:Domain of unknown function (DUF3425)